MLNILNKSKLLRIYVGLNAYVIGAFGSRKGTEKEQKKLGRRGEFTFTYIIQ